MEQTEIKLKKCNKCGRELTLDQFSKNLKSKDGLRSQCKKCDCDYQKEQTKKKKHLTKVYANPDLAKFSPRQLIEELKARGYKGSLTYEQRIEL